MQCRRKRNTSPCGRSRKTALQPWANAGPTGSIQHWRAPSAGWEAECGSQKGRLAARSSGAADFGRRPELLRAHAEAPCGLRRHSGRGARRKIPPVPGVQARGRYMFLKMPVASTCIRWPFLHCWCMLRRNHEMQYVIKVALDDGRRRCLEHFFGESHVPHFGTKTVEMVGNT